VIFRDMVLQGVWDNSLPLILALVLDLAFAEPPVAVHPVVWMGRFLTWAGRRLPEAPRSAFLLGGGFWMVGGGVCVGVGLGLEYSVTRAPSPLGWILAGIAIWPLFSLRMLFIEVASVEKGLAVSLEDGRRRLARIVSRDTSRLTEAEVRESALESLSENLSDSVIAPLFWWALLGLPGIMLYRFANTADACWGYRGAWEWKGKWAARADDVLNWVPARLTAILIGGLFRFRRLWTEAGRTPSPNGGWPMGALALRLGVRFSKPGCYVLNPKARAPERADMTRGLRICALAVVWGTALLLLLRGMLHDRL